MAGMKFEYDENGGKFYYFVLSFYALVLIPCTYYLWPRKEKKQLSHPEDTSSFGPCRDKYKLLNQNEPRKRFQQTITKGIFIVCWIIFVVLAYKVSTIEIEHKEYDPYSVLGLEKGAVDKEIRKAYRELSKVMHPDKGGDPKKFQELTLAYASLTDPATKKNWEEFGNPDGPGVTHFGIALPKWMVDDKNSIFVLGFYVLVFMIIMPTVVGLWWYKSIKYTTDKVFMITSQMYGYFYSKSPVINLIRSIMILAASFEFDRRNNPEIIDRESDNIEIPQLIKEFHNLHEKNREPPLCYPFSLKARALIYAHLSRIPVPPETLLKDQQYIIKKCPFLINEMIGMLSQLVAYANMRNANPPRLETIESVMKLSPMIVQAIWDNKCSLLQLPNIEESNLRHFATKKRNITTIKQFVATKDSDRRSILRYLTDEQYDDIMRVCEYYPHVEMIIKSEVYDDEDAHTITAGAIVTLTVTLKRQNLKVLFDKETPGVEDKQQILAIDDQASGENGENNGDVIEKPISDEVAKVNNKSTKQPWEKQKKKPKYAKSKPKSKAKVNNKVNNITSTNKKVDSTAAAAADKNKIEDIEKLKQENEGSDRDEDDNNDEDDNEDENNNNNTKNDNTDSEDQNKNLSKKGDGEDEEFFEKFQQQQKKREKLETKEKISHRVFCPYFPDVKQECWWLYAADRKQRLLISPPIYICTLKNSEEFELKFTAPKKVGIYTYTVILKSDSYLDFDVIQNIKLDVKEAKTIEDHPQWNFSDEEGDDDAPNKQDDDEYGTDEDD